MITIHPAAPCAPRPTLPPIHIPFPSWQWPNTERGWWALLCSRIITVTSIYTSHFPSIAPLMALLHTRLRGLHRRLMTIIDSIEKDLPAPAKGKPRPSRKRPTNPKPKPELRLPTKPFWLHEMFGPQFIQIDFLRNVLRQEEKLTAMLAREPTLGRVLRPICRLLGETIPPYLQLPKRPRKPRPPKPPQPKVIIPKGVRYRRPRLPHCRPGHRSPHRHPNLQTRYEVLKFPT